MYSGRESSTSQLSYFGTSQPMSPLARLHLYFLDILSMSTENLGNFK